MKRWATLISAALLAGCGAKQHLEPVLTPADLEPLIPAALSVATTAVKNNGVRYQKLLAELNGSVTERSRDYPSSISDVFPRVQPDLSKLIESPLPLISTEERITTRLHSLRLTLPIDAYERYYGRPSVTTMRSRALYGESWAKKIRQAHLPMADFEFALELSARANAAAVAASEDRGSFKDMLKAFLLELPDDKDLLTDAVESAKRELRDVSLPAIANYDLTRLMPGTQARRLSAAERAVQGLDNPLDRRQTASLLVKLVADSINQLQSGIHIVDVKTTDVLDWEPIFLEYGDLPPGRDDEELNAVTPSHITREREVLKTVSNPFGRFLAYHLAKNLIPLAYLRHRQIERSMTRIRVAIRLYRMDHNGQLPERLEDLVAARILPSLPKAPLVGDHIEYNADARTMHITPRAVLKYEHPAWFDWNVSSLRAKGQPGETGPHLTHSSVR